MEVPKMFKNDYASAARSYYSTEMSPRMQEMGMQAALSILEEKEVAKQVSRRLVRVVVVDTDSNVPVEQAMLFTSGELFTDKTDQELFFDIDLNNLLKTYNEKRVQLVDKTVKDRTQNLEPARIRDLSMVVIDIAKF